MNHAFDSLPLLDLAAERRAAAPSRTPLYDEALEIAAGLRIAPTCRLTHAHLMHPVEEGVRDRVAALVSRLDGAWGGEPPPALAWHAGLSAAIVGRYGDACALLEAALRQLPVGSDERVSAAANKHRAAIEGALWPQAVVALDILAREAPNEMPFPAERYEPLGVLGIGGFAEVYLCRDRRTGAQAVVKALVRKTAQQWPLDVFHEARVLESISHPGVPQVLAAGYVDPPRRQGAYCVLEYFDGLSLHQYVDRFGPLSWTNVCSILASVLEALDVVHRAGILHCDVKPGNILLRCDSRGWRTQLIDFGIAVRVADQAHETIDGQRRPGTVGFAPPEQIGSPFSTPITAAADVYSLGQTAIYALTAQAPGKWKLDQLGTTAGPLADVLLSCVAQEPRQRPRVEPLRRFLQQLDVRADAPPREHQTTRAPQRVSEPGTSPEVGVRENG